MKLSPTTAKKFCDSNEAWTLVVHPSGRIFLSKEDDDSYKAFEPQPSSMQASYPSAASVFGTQESAGTSAASIFGFNPVGLPPPPPAASSIFGTSKPVDGKIPPPPALPLSQTFGKVKLSFGEHGGKSDKPPAVFKFSSTSKPTDEEKDKKSDKTKQEGSVFSIGVSDTDKSPRRRPLSSSTNKDGEKSTPTGTGSTSSILSSSQNNRVALSPAVAECQRAIFAAFLWQENLVHDAMAAAFHLKLHPSITKEMRLDIAKKEKKLSQSSLKKEGNESDEEEEAGGGEIVDESLSLPNLPPTINHLVTFWDEIAVKVIENSSMPFVQPKVPDLAQELQHLYDEEKKEMEKLKKEKNKKGGAGGGGRGTTVCELCDQSFPDPVTYHMKESHPGCRKHASGWGYNSRGAFCSGWAGNCGDGGSGGSTWYLMCKDCHAKYLQQKEETKKKTPKQIVLPKMKCRKPGEPRNLPVLTAVQGMIQNAKFLLDISCDADITKAKVTTPIISRQTSTPEETKDKSLSMPRKKQQLAQEAPLPVKQKPPVPFLRSVSVAGGGMPEPMKRIHSDSSDDVLEVPPQFSRQATVGPSTDTVESSSLMMKPSMSLAKLMYQRSRKGFDCKESGYSRVLGFVQRYHDLEGLRVSMKQAMRIAVLRSFALEVKIDKYTLYTHAYCTCYNYPTSIALHNIKVIDSLSGECGLRGQ